MHRAAGNSEPHRLHRSGSTSCERLHHTAVPGNAQFHSANDAIRSRTRALRHGDMLQITSGRARDAGDDTDEWCAEQQRRLRMSWRIAPRFNRDRVAANARAKHGRLHALRVRCSGYLGHETKAQGERSPKRRHCCRFQCEFGGGSTRQALEQLDHADVVRIRRLVVGGDLDVELRRFKNERDAVGS